MKVQQVEPKYLHYVWDGAAPYLEKALEHSAGEYNLDQLKVFLVQGKQALLIATDETNGIKGAAAIEFIDYPNDRIAFITAIGGKMIANQNGWQQLEDWLRFNGATAVRGAAYESVARLWRKAFKFENRYIMVEKRL
jgi:hypothetical protein